MALTKAVSELLGFGVGSSNRNLSLLVVLIVTIVVLPFFNSLHWVQDITIAAVFLMCIRTISTTRSKAIVAWTLGAFPMLNLLLFGVVPPLFESLGRVLVLPFFVYTVFVLMKQLMTARSARSAELYAAAATYLLLGLAWGLAFAFLEIVVPGSFSFPAHDQGSANSLFYFSYVTLVTLGYGEITPVTQIARSLSVIEAMMGSLFLTILVARLVGLFSNTQTQESQQESGGESVDA